MPPSRRDELVETAMRVFYREGFNSTGIDRVLREAGISRMTLYNHFKSKDELIVAALRRRDEVFRNRMHKYIESASKDPAERLLAAFDFHEQWFTSEEFNGCMFLNASSEFADPECAIRRTAAEHVRAIGTYMLDLCRAANLQDPEQIARQIHILLEGTCAKAHAMDQVDALPERYAETIRSAKAAARLLIEAARPQAA
jgi:AcrR family transcriptional regulator